MFYLNTQLQHRYILKAPSKCGNPDRCKSYNFTQVNLVSREHCKDYQEIKIQVSFLLFCRKGRLYSSTGFYLQHFSLIYYIPFQFRMVSNSPQSKQSLCYILGNLTLTLWHGKHTNLYVCTTNLKSALYYFCFIVLSGSLYDTKRTECSLIWCIIL